MGRGGKGSLTKTFFPQSLRNRSHVHSFLNPMPTHQAERDLLRPKVRNHKRAMSVFWYSLQNTFVFYKLVFICYVYAIIISFVYVVVVFGNFD